MPGEWYAREAGEETHEYEIDGVRVLVHLQLWNDRETGEPLGPTFYLEIDGNEIFKDEEFESEWVLGEPGLPTVSELRMIINQVRPGLLDGSTDENADSSE